MASTLAIVVSLASAPAARADSRPACYGATSLITCAAADVGKPCQGAGQCYEIPCSATAPNTVFYKCDVCPTVLATSSVTCSTTNVGSPCGGGGYCMVLAPWCASPDLGYVCARPGLLGPTGPPAGETLDGGDGACAVGAAAGSTPGIAGGLAVIGLVFLSLCRRGRSR